MWRLIFLSIQLLTSHYSYLGKKRESTPTSSATLFSVPALFERSAEYSGAECAVTESGGCSDFRPDACY